MLGVIATIKSQNSFEKLCDTNLGKHPHCVYTDSNFDVRPFDQLLTPVMTIFSIGVLSALGFLSWCQNLLVTIIGAHQVNILLIVELSNPHWTVIRKMQH